MESFTLLKVIEKCIVDTDFADVDSLIQEYFSHYECLLETIQSTSSHTDDTVQSARLHAPEGETKMVFQPFSCALSMSLIGLSPIIMQDDAEMEGNSFSTQI